MQEALLIIAIAAAIHKDPREVRQAAIRVRRRLPPHQALGRIAIGAIIDARDPIAVVNRTMEDLDL